MGASERRHVMSFFQPITAAQFPPPVRIQKFQLLSPKVPQVPEKMYLDVSVFIITKFPSWPRTLLKHKCHLAFPMGNQNKSAANLAQGSLSRKSWILL